MVADRPALAEDARLQGQQVTTPSLDWVAYFRAFCEAHGAPVLWGGRLLFADGWTYSSTDHAGPEWPPPADPALLRQAQKDYWRRRHQVSNAQMHDLAQELFSLEELQRGKSLPILQSQTAVGPSGAVTFDERPVDFEAMRQRLTWLEDDVRECLQHLEELSDEPAAAG